MIQSASQPSDHLVSEGIGVSKWVEGRPVFHLSIFHAWASLDALLRHMRMQDITGRSLRIAANFPTEHTVSHEANHLET